MGYTVKSKQNLEGIQTLTGNPIALDNVRGSIGRILASKEEQKQASKKQTSSDYKGKEAVSLPPTFFCLWVAGFYSFFIASLPNAIFRVLEVRQLFHFSFLSDLPRLKVYDFFK